MKINSSSSKKRTESSSKQEHRGKVDPFYNSKRWYKLRDKVWIRDDNECQICKELGIMHILVRGTKDLNYQGTVDHIIPRNAGGKDNLENLRLVGSRCHARKSNKDKKYYKR